MKLFPFFFFYKQEHHDRILALQESITRTTKLNEELQIDINDLHEARREDANNHNNILEKFKRRETNLEQVRHDALVECKSYMIW